MRAFSLELNIDNWGLCTEERHTKLLVLSCWLFFVFKKVNVFPVSQIVLTFVFFVGYIVSVSSVVEILREIHKFQKSNLFIKISLLP